MLRPIGKPICAFGDRGIPNSVVMREPDSGINCLKSRGFVESRICSVERLKVVGLQFTPVKAIQLAASGRWSPCSLFRRSRTSSAMVSLVSPNDGTNASSAECRGHCCHPSVPAGDTAPSGRMP